MVVSDAWFGNISLDGGYHFPEDVCHTNLYVKSGTLVTQVEIWLDSRTGAVLALLAPYVAQQDLYEAHPRLVVSYAYSWWQRVRPHVHVSFSVAPS